MAPSMKRLLEFLVHCWNKNPLQILSQLFKYDFFLWIEFFLSNCGLNLLWSSHLVSILEHDQGTNVENDDGNTKISECYDD